MQPPPAPAAHLLDELRGAVLMAHALAEVGRPLDLAGLADLAGRACAAALDLPPPDGRALRPALIAALAELDALTAACRAACGAAP